MKSCLVSIVLTLKSVNEILKCGHPMKAMKQYFSVLLLYFKSLLKNCHLFPLSTWILLGTAYTLLFSRKWQRFWNPKRASPADPLGGITCQHQQKWTKKCRIMLLVCSYNRSKANKWGRVLKSNYLTWKHFFICSFHYDIVTCLIL